MSEQTGSTSANNLPFVAYAILDYEEGATDIRNQVADFSFATSILRLNCTGLKENEAISELTLCGMSSECVLEITGSGVTVAEGEINDIEVSLSDVSAKANGTQTIYAAVAKNGTEGPQTVHLKQESDYFYGFGTRKNEAGKSYNAICLFKTRMSIPSLFSVSATKKVNFSSANLWADADNHLHFESDQHKVATSWDPGHVTLFSWSETVANSVKTDKTNAGAYLFCDGAEGRKVSVDGSDAIFYALTGEEWDYLLKYRTNAANKNKIVTVNGVKGLVIAPDDVTLSSKTSYYESELDTQNLVFLPCAGGRAGDSVVDVNNVGNYWSSSPKDNNSSYLIMISDGGKTYGNVTRVNGYSLRLVTDATN